MSKKRNLRTLCRKREIFGNLYCGDKSYEEFLGFRFEKKAI
jgi:hypothetical protein